MAALLLLAGILSLPPGAEYLVLRTGEAIPMAGSAELNGSRVVFRDPAGRLYSLDLQEVDQEETARRASGRPAAEPTPAPVRRLAVSEEEQRRLARELAKSKGRRPALAASPSPEPDSSRAGPPVRDRGEDEDEWRSRARAAQAQVDRSRAQLEALQRHEKQLEAQLLMLRGYGDHMLTAQLLELERTRHALGLARDAVEEAKRAQFELQEEARVKDILPGWLR
jgi:hypothetical protein